MGGLDTWDRAAELKPADYLKAARELEAAPAEHPPLRVAILSSYTLEFLRPFLTVEAARLGLSVAAYFGPYGQFEQELASADSGLRAFRPDVLVLALRLEDVDPDATVRYHQSSGQRFRALAADVTGRLSGCARLFREGSAGPVLVANFATPPDPPLGPFEANSAQSLTGAVVDANARLLDQVGAVSGAVIWDYAGLVGHAGRGGWIDPRLWALARIPVAARHHPTLAAHLARTIRGVLRPMAKCLVLDLDDTLWGGVIGDDGVEGIRLGDDHPGSAYKAFQRRVLGLMDRGILLAVASKNDPEVVEHAFRHHPEMLIRWEDLAAVRINWEPKSGNLRAIAAELNLGADALVFFDDNPVERAEVRANAPEVRVVEVPADPLAYGDALARVWDFDQPSLSDEDRARATMYRLDRQRSALAATARSPDEFLASLEMVATVGEADAGTLGRVAQLVAKTNQFNLTTRRHGPAELAAMAADPATVVAWLRLADRFGDQGLVGVAILRREGEQGLIDTLLMSCRVMNRRVEQALAAYLVEHARRLGCRELIGHYLPTRKNGMVRDLYPRLGFTATDDTGGRFALRLGETDITWPEVIQRVSAAPASVPVG
jgi:FkbH-like protein